MSRDELKSGRVVVLNGRNGFIEFASDLLESSFPIDFVAAFVPPLA